MCILIVNNLHVRLIAYFLCYIQAKFPMFPVTCRIHSAAALRPIFVRHYHYLAFCTSKYQKKYMWFIPKTIQHTSTGIKQHKFSFNTVYY